MSGLRTVEEGERELCASRLFNHNCRLSFRMQVSSAFQDTFIANSNNSTPNRQEGNENNMDRTT